MTNHQSRQQFRPPSLPEVKVEGFWKPIVQVVREKTSKVLYDRCIAAGTLEQIDVDLPVPELRIPLNEGGVTMQMFWDSDIGKILEMFSYLLADKRDAEIEKKADGFIELLKKLQQPDGYMDSWYLRMQPGKRWTNMRDCHELYNAGHLLEGAVAYYQATGKRDFLDIMERLLTHVESMFGTEEGKRRGYPGHEVLSLALVKLYRLTDEERWLKLAEYFINERGRKPNYFDLEAEARGETKNLNPSETHEYDQSHLPVREQDKVVGHAVRAMYLYCGMADVSMETGDESLRVALDRLWDDLVSKRLYLTGGMGPSKKNEGFTEDYDFPNATAYAETCATVGLAFWAHRMLGFGPDIRYADVMEQALYNGALSGLGQDGAHFFYENPLESNGTHNRYEWHRCPCCPPNISRLIASIGTYIYSCAEDALAVHLFCQSTGCFKISGGEVTIKQETNYPWDGAVRISVENSSAGEFTLATRIPGWSTGATAKLNGEEITIAENSEKGYLILNRDWKDGDTLELDIPMAVHTLYAHPNIKQDVNRVALVRGPLVYCLEEVDNKIPLNRIFVDPNTEFKSEFREDLLGGITVITGKARAKRIDDWGIQLYRVKPAEWCDMEITAIPYYLWDNRDPGEMLVWLPLYNSCEQ